MIPKSLTFLCAVACLALQVGSAQTRWREVSNFHFDWNGRQNVRTILEIREDRMGEDFTRIRILVPGEKSFAVTNARGWVKFRSEAAITSAKVLSYKNLVRSEYVLVQNASEQGRMLLILVGNSFASSPGSLDVIELPPTGPPRIVLHRDELGLQELRDLDGDGTAELVGYPCLSQESGNGMLTYDPFNVYKLGLVPGDPATISIQISRNYNVDHYYGWAGINCSEKIAVVLHPSGGKKPKIMSTKEAERLTKDHP